MAQVPAKPCLSLNAPSDTLPGAERLGEPEDVAARLRRRKLESLRQRIRSIERDVGLMQEAAPSRFLRHLRSNPLATPAAPLSRARRASDETGSIWRIGADEVDALLGPEGLEIGGVHEVKPTLGGPGIGWAAAWAAALVFSLALGIRRCFADRRMRESPILFCRPTALVNELGSLYGPGLRALGLAPNRLVIVETANGADTLWAMEEGLKSRSLALVIGLLDKAALTPARRLALVAAAHNSPCLLLTHPRTEVTAATATRWRVGPAVSAPHPFDPHAPGAPRFTVDLERCRAQPLSAETASFSLEWCDEALCFRLAPGVADRADAARKSGRGA